MELQQHSIQEPKLKAMFRPLVRQVVPVTKREAQQKTKVKSRIVQEMRYRQLLVIGVSNVLARREFRLCRRPKIAAAVLLHPQWWALHSRM
jgi:hypothetical protein